MWLQIWLKNAIEPYENISMPTWVARFRFPVDAGADPGIYVSWGALDRRGVWGPPSLSENVKKILQMLQQTFFLLLNVSFPPLLPLSSPPPLSFLRGEGGTLSISFYVVYPSTPLSKWLFVFFFNNQNPIGSALKVELKYPIVLACLWEPWGDKYMYLSLAGLSCDISM